MVSILSRILRLSFFIGSGPSIKCHLAITLTLLSNCLQNYLEPEALNKNPADATYKVAECWCHVSKSECDSFFSYVFKKDWWWLLMPQGSTPSMPSFSKRVRAIAGWSQIEKTQWLSFCSGLRHRRHTCPHCTCWDTPVFPWREMEGLSFFRDVQAVWTFLWVQYVWCPAWSGEIRNS